MKSGIGLPGTRKRNATRRITIHGLRIVSAPKTWGGTRVGWYITIRGIRQFCCQLLRSEAIAAVATRHGYPVTKTDIEAALHREEA